MIGELKLARACGADKLVFQGNVAFALGFTDFKVVLPKDFRGIYGEVSLEWFLNAAGSKPTKIEDREGNLFVQEGRFKSTCGLLPPEGMEDQLKNLRIKPDEGLEMTDTERTSLLECVDIADLAIQHALKKVFFQTGKIYACDNVSLRVRDFPTPKKDLELPTDQVPLKKVLKYADRLVFDDLHVKCKMKKAMCLLPIAELGSLKFTDHLKSKRFEIAESEASFLPVVQRIKGNTSGEPIRLIFEKGKVLKMTSTNKHENSVASVVIPEVRCTETFSCTARPDMLSRLSNYPGKFYHTMDKKALCVEHVTGLDICMLLTGN